MLTLICGVGRAGKTTYSKHFKNVIHLDNYFPPSKRYEFVNKKLQNIEDNDIVVEGIYNTSQLRIKLLNSYQGINKKCIWLNTSKDLVQERLKKIYIPLFKEHMFFEPPLYNQGWDEIIII